MRALREVDAPQGRKEGESSGSSQGVTEQLSTVEIHQGVPEDSVAEKETNFDEIYLMVDNMISDEDIPKNVQEAMLSPWAREWKQAMEEELKSLNARKVFEGPIKVPKGKKLISCKWVFAQSST